MKIEKYFIYTDASYSHLDGFAVSGFLIFDGLKAHQASQFTKDGVRTYFFKEENNIRAEIVGAMHALNLFIEERKKEKVSLDDIEVNLYSDCQTLTNLLQRREKLEATDFISARKKTTLPNATLYKDFFSLYDELKPKIHWLEGHSKKATQSLEQKHFALVDKQVRQELRATVKSLPGK
jgi:ribonuclease HI